MSGKKTIAVTGGAGYIGSHTWLELVANGFEVIIIDNFSNSREIVLPSLENISGIKPRLERIDLCDANSTRQFFSSHRIDAVIHFAAYKSVIESVEHPMMYYRNNLVSLMNVLEACKESGVKNFVFSSSCSVYGNPDTLPVDENAELKPAQSPYGYTKQICEQMLKDFYNHAEMHVVALRYFNPVGAHESALIGEFPINAPNSLVPVITQTAAGLRKEMHVFGTDYDTPDGTCIRDFIHETDIAKAHVMALNYLLKSDQKSSFEIFNLGTGKGITIMEVIRSFEKVSGTKLNYKLSPRRAGDVVKVYADANAANKILGWKAEKSLDEMIRSAWNWELALKNLTPEKK